jgi:hypothetical protein
MSAVPPLPTVNTVVPLSYDEQLARGLVGPNILLNGEAGTGKTFALGTLADWCERNNRKMFYLDIEGSLETLLGYWRDVGVPPFNRKEAAPVPASLHWHQMRTVPVSLAQMLKGAKDTGEMSYELLTKMQDNARGGQNNSFWKILTAMSDFPDDRTSKRFGPVDQFGVDKVFVLDSFTELSNSAAKMVIGAKPTMAPPDYGVAQNHLMNFLRLITHGTAATFVMTAHPVRDKDELTGGVRTTITTVGTAIQPQIPPLFSDMIYTVREADRFYWDTAAYGVVTKTRSLGYKSKITPDFGQIMDLWVKRGSGK